VVPVTGIVIMLVVPVVVGRIRVVVEVVEVIGVVVVPVPVVGTNAVVGTLMVGEIPPAQLEKQEVMLL